MKEYKNQSLNIVIEDDNSIIIKKDDNRISMTLGESIGMITILQQVIRDNQDKFKR